MALTNAEKQKRWRQRRNGLAQALIGDAPWIAEKIFSELGVKKTKRVADHLRRRLKAIDPNCQLCKGTGITQGELAGRCPCSPRNIPSISQVRESPVSNIRGTMKPPVRPMPQIDGSGHL
jgi:hypothetical protein